MLPPLRRRIGGSILLVSLSLLLWNTLLGLVPHHQPVPPQAIDQVIHPGFLKPKFRWRDLPQQHPLHEYTPLPSGPKVSIPQVQHDFAPETLQQAAERKRRLSAVEAAFRHSWDGYRKNAWLQDEVSPLTGESRNPFGGWAATLVDTLDSLWIMGMKKEFHRAVSGLKKVEFTTATLREVNVFETTIRHLGGLLSAYDVSGHQYHILLQRAVELGEMIYHAFDTPNRLPVTRWDWQKTALGEDQEAKSQSLVAELGSLTLEFTRLSQLTGDPKWYDAVARIMNLFGEQQNQTKVPGLWPTFVNARDGDFKKATTFTMGGMADSLYEYLPKQHLMLGGQSVQYRDMYLTALPKAKKHLFFRPLTPGNEKVLFTGTAKGYSSHNIKLQPQGEHLGCFAGGMVALAAKVFHQNHDLETARELVDGCIWAYESMPAGIMGEISSFLPCKESDLANCMWDEDLWKRTVVEKNNRGFVPDKFSDEAQQVIKAKKLPPGFTEIDDARYILRPEAIESVFVLYRITGDESLREKAWHMFESINNATRTSIAHAALKDVTQSGPEREFLDTMESFWTAETLKYFYLIFSDPSVISLDEYVLNTEAHPLLQPK